MRWTHQLIILAIYALLTLWLISSTETRAALTVINETNQTRSSRPYLNDISVPIKAAFDKAVAKQKKNFEPKDIDFDALLYPINSGWTSGHFVPHKLKSTKSQLFTTPIFIISDGPPSIHWMKQHASFLRKTHAVGLMTNINTFAQGDALMRSTGFNLTPADIDGLEKLTGTNHYPLLLYKGEVWQ